MDYNLDIISHMPQFKSQRFIQHHVNGVDHIGVWGDEAYELRFYNNSHRKVQVRLSIDGTDILTGAKATLDPKGKMWVVNPYDNLPLQAWPENTKNGSRFVFASGGDSVTVAHNTHGDLSNKGIIAAAVFTEGFRAGIVRTSEVRRSSSIWPQKRHSLMADRIEANSARSFTKSAAPAADPGTGAEETIAQSIGSAVGLTDPTLHTIINVRYIWWDDLKAMLSEYRPSLPQPNGFFQTPELLIDLKSTPKIEPMRISL